MQPRLWLVIISAGVMLALTLGIRQSLGLFLAPVSTTLGSGRDVFALGMGLMNLVWGLTAPLTGMIADRSGFARTAAAGVACYAAGLYVMTLPGSGTQFLLAGLLLGLGLSGAGFTVALAAVGKIAPEAGRSKSLGIATLGGAIGQFAALPLVHALLSLYGWVECLLLLGVGALLILPFSRGLAIPVHNPAAPPASPVRALRRALGSGGFVLLSAGFTVCGFQLAFIGIHLPAYLKDQGMPGWLGAAALTLVGLTNIAGTYGCGHLGGLFPKRFILSGLYLARSALVLLFLLVPPHPAGVLAFGALMGLLWLGTVPLTSGLVAVMFGQGNLSMLFGFVFLGHQVGGFFGAWLAGYLYDLTGDYQIMWWISIGLGLLAALLHWPIYERPVKDRQPAPAS